MHTRRNWILSAFVAMGLTLSGTALAQDRSELVSARETLAKWVEIQQLISKEREEWELGKQVLDQRISLIRDEIATLEERTESIESSIGESDVTRRELLNEKQQLAAATSNLGTKIDSLESRARTLVAGLPDPIRERIDPLAGRLPSDSSSTRLSLSERYQNVIGILNEVNKFNRVITVTSEVRELPDGTVSEVRALYLGLGQAYYVTANGSAAGIGTSTPDGWQWKPANQLAPRVAQAIAIMENEEVPAYVPLPVEVQ